VLPKRNCLTKEKDFQKIFRTGKTFVEKFIVLKLLPNGLDFSRFAFAVGLKISKKAVIRNKIKRQLGEIIRVAWDDIRQGCDVIVLLKKEIAGKDYGEIERTTRDALRKAGLLNN